jgi:hypothetical protein
LCPHLIAYHFWFSQQSPLRVTTIDISSKEGETWQKKWLVNFSYEVSLSYHKSKIRLYCYLHSGEKGERSYNSYSFLTSTLDRVSGQRHALALLYLQGKDPRVPIGLGAGWASELVWTQRLEEKSFSCPGD